ncbi:hypothetical protein AWB74_06095 [Caballeronia arvi]|uniref:Transmembrane protein n=1 Tax=Caballeronia arvi TaxID=1777135 RepID=A0A158KLA2_9BURK|nr:hypothetical protein AWB74_06095 [Caballeronia arvi]
MPESFSTLVTLLKSAWAVSLLIAAPIGVFVGILVGLATLRKSRLETKKEQDGATDSRSFLSRWALPVGTSRFSGIFWIVVIVVAVTDVVATLVWGMIHGR